MITVQQITQTAGTGIPLDKQHFFKNILFATDFSPSNSAWYLLGRHEPDPTIQIHL
jgi:hypothetical protein